jgi:hypothetical protein
VPNKSASSPTRRVLPTSDDLAAGPDPVLARAVETAGGPLTPNRPVVCSSRLSRCQLQ